MSLSFLSQGNNKQVVGLSLTPGIGLEGVILDKDRSQISAYGKRNVGYNFSLREIQDIAEFKTELTSLIKELGVQPKTPVYFVLPNILFDFMEYPSDVGEDGLKMMVLSKAEEFYLFKKEEPQSGWCDVINKDGGDQKKIAYTSFQKSTIDTIKATINDDLGLQLIGVESAYSATLRGLSVTGQLEEIMLEEAAWTMMLVNANSYTLFHMEADRLISYNEVPLALKSFSMEEAYQAIVSSSSQLLVNFPSSKLFIVSQTDDISADILKRELKFDKEIIAINSNKFSKDPIMQILSTPDPENSKYLTLGAIGAACPKCDFQLTINVMQDDPDIAFGSYKIPFNGKVYEVNGAQIQNCLIIAGVAFVLLFGSISGVFFALKSGSEKKLSEINDQISQKQQKIDALSSVEEKKPEVDMTSVINSVANMNVSAINFYDSISVDIPKNIWLTKYYNKEGNKIVIKGVAENIVDIYEYYKNLKVVSPQSDIKLTNIQVVASEPAEGEEDLLKNLNINKDTDRLYSFEISNTTMGVIEQPTESQGEGDKAAAPKSSNLLQAPPSKKIEETSEQMTVAE